MTLDNFILALICTVIGIAAGLFAARLTYMSKIGAVLHIDRSNIEKDIYRIDMLIPFDELDKWKYLRMEIKNDNEEE